MKVMTISGFGGPEVFSLHEMPEPTVGEGQVVIDVKASSVNPIDLKIRSAWSLQPHRHFQQSCMATSLES